MSGKWTADDADYTDKKVERDLPWRAVVIEGGERVGNHSRAAITF